MKQVLIRCMGVLGIALIAWMAFFAGKIWNQNQTDVQYYELVGSIDDVHISVEDTIYYRTQAQEFLSGAQSELPWLEESMSLAEQNQLVHRMEEYQVVKSTITLSNLSTQDLMHTCRFDVENPDWEVFIYADHYRDPRPYIYSGQSITGEVLLFIPATGDPAEILAGTTVTASFFCDRPGVYCRSTMTFSPDKLDFFD